MIPRIVRIRESTWRENAHRHQERIFELLQDGLTPLDHPLNREWLRRNGKNNEFESQKKWTALDPRHPVFNFLIEYYGLKGSKGTRRLARWAPSICLLADHGCIDNGGILLEGASENDLGGTLHLRGATIKDDGILYNPSIFFGKFDSALQEDAVRLAKPYIWFQSILAQTLSAEPVMHCHGLHEWAMQYQPEGADAPPSAKYQAHLPLRVSREIINQTVERKGVHCTHVDALRFFAPAARPLSYHGAPLERMDQLRLEQPACVHAQMDLLKFSLRMQPFGDCELLQRVLELALRSRRLDVSASPYDASQYNVGVVPVENSEGRKLYRKEQARLMSNADPIRRDLLNVYHVFLQSAFQPDALAGAQPSFASAKPKRLAVVNSSQ